MKRIIPTLIVAASAVHASAQVITPLPYPDGRNPGSLTVSEGVLYGFDWGGTVTTRIFKMSTDGTGFTTLKGYDLEDRFTPIVRPTVSGSTLFGVGSGRGILQQQPYDVSRGVVYRMNTDGTGFTVLQHIEDRYPGPSPDGNGLRGLVLSGNAIYGAAPSGAIYRIDLVPTLSIKRTGANSLAVTWPSVWTDYVLQQNVNGVSSLNWNNVADPIQNDGTNKTLVINPAGGGRFYRLVSP